MFDDWFQSLQRASEWNQWTNDETLIQLAGHLRGYALQEWTLLRPTEKESVVVPALRSHLDSGSRALAAQDFRHASQRKNESALVDWSNYFPLPTEEKECQMRRGTLCYTASCRKDFTMS